MKITKIGEPRILMSAPDAARRYFAWPTVARLKNGRIALSASGFRYRHVCPFGKAVLSFSDDEGETFSYPVPIIDTALDDRDSGLCPFGDHGLILTSFNNTVKFQRDYLDKTTEQRKHSSEWASILFSTDQKERQTFLDYLDTVTPE